MRLAFFGTPDFAVPALDALIAAGHEIVCVYTQPPRAAGRGGKQRRSPVHDLADGVKVNYGKFGDLLAEVKTVHGTNNDARRCTTLPSGRTLRCARHRP